MRYQIEGADIKVAGALGRGDSFYSLSIVASTPDSPILYVESDDEPRLIAYLQQLQDQGHILKYRPELVNAYGVRWLPDQPGIRAVSDPQLGDTYHLFLEQITPLLEAVDYGNGAVIYGFDTGVDPTHPDLIHVEGELIDTVGHGTFTMWQIAYLLKKARAISIRVLDGPNGSGSEVTIIQKLLAGLEHWIGSGQPPAVGNNSWGGAASRGIDAAYSYVHKSGLWLTNAQGNEGAAATVPSSPTRVAEFVAAAMDRELNVASFSSGLDTWPITTAFYSGCDEWGANLGSGYTQKSGTSMADPWLTASLIILKLLRPDFDVTDALSYIYTHSQAMAKSTQNGRGHGMLGIDLLPSAEPLPASEASIDTLIQNLAEAGAIYDSIMHVTENKRVLALVQQAQPLRVAAMDCAWQVKNEMLADESPPMNGKLGSGVYPMQFGPDPRDHCRVMIPANPTGDVDILWAGGAWQDDAIPLWNTFWRPSGKTPTINDHEMMPEEVTNFYLDARHILVLGSYPLGNIERAIASQRALTDYVYRHCGEWGGDKAKIVLSGHSAGGHGAVVSALWHEGPRIKAVVGMAAACLCIDKKWEHTKIGNTIKQPWGSPDSWGAYSAHNMVRDREDRQTIYLVHGRQDDQVPLVMSERFQDIAGQFGHTVHLYAIAGGHGEPGSTRTPETAAALHAAWS